MNIEEKLLQLQDLKYRDFNSKLVPNIDKDLIIGVRVPELRKLASELIKTDSFEGFLDDLPHKYYDENVLHSLIISLIKDYNECVRRIDDFLPYVDNWAVCDILSPVIFRKCRTELLTKVLEWSESKYCYTCRFGVGMLMSHYLDDDFKACYLDIPAKIQSDEYYVNMMIAWFFATALAKQWDATIPYIENRIMSPWVQNKIIQKSRDSYRVTEKQKEYLKSLKVKVK
ncbi:MAG: DNA alkylation repair protein [Peptostreptococcaceae bacterium]|nr:DNA alkylation repair protein [Peptostreptococcaceae bacterium]MDY5738877.1 DNA alkylation repair protein [Anaerovoracaceae bacterium]